MRVNPDAAVSTKARALVETWLKRELHATDAAAIPADALGQLVDTIAWTMQDAIDAATGEHERNFRVVVEQLSECARRLRVEQRRREDMA